MNTISAELTWIGDRFTPSVAVSTAGGRITAVNDATHVTHARRALIPGFVNGHSHAFQRGLRGRGETFPSGAGSFWSWREAMYALAARLDAQSFRATAAQAFREMRRSGITTVCEFHYFHHSTTEARDFAFDEQILLAARDAGIRIVLLQTYYAAGGIGKPLEPAQHRFATVTPDEYWNGVDRIETMLDPARESIGAVVHSIRAASIADLEAIHAESRRRGLPFHMHVEEQDREIEDCRAAYGRTPMRVLLDSIEIDERFTAVHCTRTAPEEMRELIDRGGRVCITPLTEGNLGDGIPDVTNLPIDHISLGSDSNARISMFEEMRWLEYGQRWAGRRRGAFTDTQGRNGVPILHAATRGGALSAGIDAGEIREGSLADFALIDLDHPSLAGVDAESLPDALVFGCSEEVIAGTCVGGQWDTQE